MISGLPQQGQPLDLQYISELAQSIVELNSAVSSKSFSKSLVRNKDLILKNDRTSNFSFYASFLEVVNDETIQPGSVKKFTHNFTTSFITTPVATATPVNLAKGTTGQDVAVVITDITPGSISGVLKFNNATAGVASVGINIIAIGLQGTI
jgi:arginyl-tRNA--protein-N-Asp/Glu arginylyltransferase